MSLDEFYHGMKAPIIPATQATARKTREAPRPARPLAPGLTSQMSSCRRLQCVGGLKPKSDVIGLDGRGSIRHVGSWAPTAHDASIAEVFTTADSSFLLAALLQVKIQSEIFY